MHLQRIASSVIRRRAMPGCCAR